MLLEETLVKLGPKAVSDQTAQNEQQTNDISGFKRFVICEEKENKKNRVDK